MCVCVCVCVCGKIKEISKMKIRTSIYISLCLYLLFSLPFIQKSVFMYISFLKHFTKQNYEARLVTRILILRQ